MNGVQKGTQSGSLEVDARGYVGDDSVSRIRLRELVDLTLYIGTLFGIGDPSVDDVTSSALIFSIAKEGS